MKRFANMTEFAAALNLDRSTVSYILNDKWRQRNISPETVKRVRDFAAEVNFLPNFFGRAIRGKVRNDTAVLLPVNAFRHHQEAFFRLIGTLESQNVKPLILPVSATEKNQLLLEQISAYHVKRILFMAYPVIRKENIAVWEGMISALPETQWLLYDWSERDAAGHFDRLDNAGWVGFDRTDGLRTVCRYVMDAGFPDLLCCGFGKNAFQDMPLPCCFLPEQENTRKENKFPAEELIRYRESHFRKEPQAVFINDDLVSGRIIRELSDAGYRIPEDFSIISWDGLEASRYFAKSLCTLEIPHESMLAEAESFFTGKTPLCRKMFEFRIREGSSMQGKKL